MNLLHIADLKEGRVQVCGGVGIMLKALMKITSPLLTPMSAEDLVDLLPGVSLVRFSWRC